MSRLRVDNRAVFGIISPIGKMNQVVAITKALSDSTRIRILLMLRFGPLCVCQIRAVLGLAMSTISKHMAVLSRTGLVVAKRQGKWVYYRHNPNASGPAKAAIDWLVRYAAGEDVVCRDLERLEVVLSMDRDQLCPKRHRR